jgi:lipopolysaccharide core heptose(I) kinase
VKSFAFDVWDGGRLTVSREFAPLLRQNGLTTFDALMSFSGGQVAKNVLRERTTTRIDLPDESGEPRSFFLKRHERPPLLEIVKPWLRLQRPLHGARNEWDAILRFHQTGLATMVPAALGESQGRSFLLTTAIEGCRKLTEWMAEHQGALRNGQLQTLRQIIAGVADVARTMHQAGLHHQDFYLTHLMVPLGAKETTPVPIHVLDLGRVRWQRPLSARWIVKDLGQLNYSASRISASDRLRFLMAYLGRPVQKSDRTLIRRVLGKSRAIARHTQKNGL